jgi:hypothetical protein
MSTAQAAAETAAAATAAKASQVAAYGGSASAVYFGLTANEFAALGGLIVGALGMIANVIISAFFKWKHLKLAQRRLTDQEKHNGL